MTCLYCGNTSGIKDSTGNCVSCGSPLSKNFVEKEKTKLEILQNDLLALWSVEANRVKCGVPLKNPYKDVYDICWTSLSVAIESKINEIETEKRNKNG